MLDNKQHVEKIEISGFRGLSNLSLDGLGAFNILLGANDVGKTSVMEAIFMLTGYSNMVLPITIQGWRDVQTINFDHLEVLFHKLDLKKPIKLEADLNGLVKHMKLEVSAIYGKIESQHIAGNGNENVQRIETAKQPGDQSSSEISTGPIGLQYRARSKNQRGKISRFNNSFRVINNGINLEKPLDEEPAILSRYVTPKIKYNSKLVSELIVNKKKEEFIGFLQQINPAIIDISTDNNFAYVDVGIRKMIAINMFGSGMIRLFSILPSCILRKEQILLIDELENGLHHKAILELLKVLLAFSRANGIQVFATTHSVEIINCLLQLLREEKFCDYRTATKCYTLAKDKDGFIHTYRYEYEQFDHCIKHGIEIR